MGNVVFTHRNQGGATTQGRTMRNVVSGTRPFSNFNGTNKQITSRARVYVWDDCPTLSGSFGNWRADFSAGEPGSGGTMQLFLTVVTRTGTQIPITWGGQPSKTFADGEEAFHDPMPNPAQFMGDWYYYDVYAIFSNGILYTVPISSTHGEGFEFGVTVPDKRGLGNITATFGLGPMRPLSVVGLSSRPAPVGCGTSRVVGQGDGTSAAIQNRFNTFGLIARSLGSQMSFGTFGTVSARLVNDIGAGLYDKREAIIKRDYTHILSDYGTNDIFAATRTGAQALADYNTWAAKFVNMPIYALTSEPQATSTNGFIDTINQTTLANNPQRIIFNDGLITSASFTRVIPINQVLEKTADSGLWTPYKGAPVTGDGVHHNFLGYTLIQNSGMIHPGLFN